MGEAKSNAENSPNSCGFFSAAENPIGAVERLLEISKYDAGPFCNFRMELRD